MAPATIAPQARRELLAASNWISADSPRAALRLTETMLAAADALGRNPYLGQEQPDLVRPPFRLFRLKGFPYVLAYNPSRKPPVIARLLHEARDLADALKSL
ncbi:type II toxin-antitoxin system RelE/ParE family toxin [Caulobacter sp. D4A]|uniref:type II toxin-antitoxin system RelE/ParE family toxin n=1 Tax=unclassified Caulobacter TaxID=2648921 RepID=UPI000D72C901|nr:MULTISPECIES: type II toxin-antitoxin system RelE/ParE family toxin [unclassified Caulobacter]PXA90290.1 type II toxin-antitoxin system RelE/ParE family toxin [Caulobacter sp. D4A]PXA96402.1 type II toxin-antitoxin system RelE/ParE family toxin [Caulobacter sp. D5]